MTLVLNDYKFKMTPFWIKTRYEQLSEKRFGFQTREV